MAGVSAEKIKYLDLSLFYLSAYLKASKRIKSALLQIGPIQGTNYDRYIGSAHFESY